MDQPRVPAGSPEGGQFAPVTDKSGRPLVVYHGSVSKISVEDLDPTAKPIRARTGPAAAVFFTPDQRAAAGYAWPPKQPGVKQKPGTVLAAHISIQNPLNITKDIKKGQKAGLSFGEAKKKAIEKLTGSNDGIIFEGNSYNVPEYVVFSKKQIRPVK